MKKTWREKLEADHGLPKVVPIPAKMQKRLGKGKMLVPSPLLIDEFVRKVKKGKLITPHQIREALARKFKAEVCCPMTTGIFLRICAETAEEDWARGKSKITPWWRVINDNGGLMEKFPKAPKAQKSRLTAEGFKFIQIKGKILVKGFERYLMKI